MSICPRGTSTCVSRGHDRRQARGDLDATALHADQNQETRIRGLPHDVLGHSVERALDRAGVQEELALFRRHSEAQT